MEVNATMLIANQQSNFNRDPSIDPTVQTCKLVLFCAQSDCSWHTASENLQFRFVS